RFVLVDDHVSLTARNGDRGNFPIETAVFARSAGASQGLEGELILLLPCKGVFFYAGLSEYAHGRAFLVGVFQAVQCHMVVYGGMAVAVALAPTQKQVRGVAHAFLTAGNHHRGTACRQEVMAEHGSLQAGTTHLVNCGAGHALRQTGTRSEEHTSELQSRENLVCRLLLEKKKKD